MAQCTHSTSPSRLELDKVVALTSHFLKDPEPRTMGYLTTVTNALGKSSQIVYNAAKQKIADVDALGNEPLTPMTTSGAWRRS